MAARILVVDDDAAALRLVCDLLRKEGFEVHGAASAAEAEALFAAEPSDLAVVDKSMPGVSGLELIRRLRRSAPELPAILMSCYPEPLLAGGIKLQGYLARPFARLSVVTAAVRQALGAAKPKQGVPPSCGGRGLSGEATSC